MQLRPVTPTLVRWRNGKRAGLRNQSPQGGESSSLSRTTISLWPVGQLEVRPVLTRDVGGSIPSGPAISLPLGVTDSVPAYEAGGGGSNPSAATTHSVE